MTLVPLAPAVESLLAAVKNADSMMSSQRTLLDRTFDLHNDLTDWATNTEHTEAALEVMAILEKYVAVTMKDPALNEVLSPEQPG